MMKLAAIKSGANLQFFSFVCCFGVFSIDVANTMGNVWCVAMKIYSFIASDNRLFVLCFFRMLCLRRVLFIFYFHFFLFAPSLCCVESSPTFFLVGKNGI